MMIQHDWVPRRWWLAGILGLGLVAGQVNAAVPTLVQVEGVLKANGGGVVADGSYKLTLAIYKDAIGGAPLWVEPGVVVGVQGGAFNYLLGSNAPIKPESLAGLSQAWFGVTVEGDPELPRRPLGSAPFALRAGLAEGMDCTGCVTLGQLDPAVLAPFVKTAELAAVAKSGAYADLKGTPELAVYAKAADLAAVAKSGAYADLKGAPDLNVYAKLNGLAAVAMSGAFGDLKNVPDLAVYAKATDLAPVAKSGAYADLKGAPDLNVYAKTAGLAGVALTGAYADLNGAPKLGSSCGTGLWLRGLKEDGGLDCAAIGDFLPLSGGTIGGTLQVNGALALGKSPIQGGRFDVVDTTKATCDGSVAGQVVLGSANQRLFFCDGKAWRRLATCTGVCPDPATVTCGQPLLDTCGDACPNTGTLCSANFQCVSGKCVAPLGNKDNPAASCLALKNAVPGTASGLYWLDPDGGDIGNAFQTWCDMTLDGGGWTLIAIVGQDARPGQWTGGTYPRAGATFYGTASAALGDILVAAKNDSGVKHFSVQGKALFANSATREVMAWVGGVTDDYLKVALPATCNPFDPAAYCAENGMMGLKLVESSGKVITTNGQMCNSVGDPCGHNEVGFHLLEGGDNVGCLCHTTGAGTGFQGLGRMWTTFQRSDGGHWNTGVHSAWKGNFDQPGALLVR